MIDTEEYRKLREAMELLSIVPISKHRMEARKHVLRALEELERDYLATVPKAESDKNSP